MPTYILFADIADGFVRSENANYATAVNGSTFNVNSIDTIASVGQFHNGTVFQITQAFFFFNTSVIPETDTVDSALFALRGVGGIFTDLDTNFTLEVRSFDWDLLDSSDWRTPAQLAALDLLTQYATVGGWVTGAGNYNNIGSIPPSYIKKAGSSGLGGGITYIMCNSDRNRTQTAPAANTGEFVGFATADTSGTSEDPRLTVETTAAAVFSPFSGNSMNIGIGLPGVGWLG